MTTSHAIVVVAGGLGLAACSFNMPSMDFFSSKPMTASLSIESDPPGADAKLSVGGNCRTPCTQTVMLGSDFTVTVSLNGYMPQTRTVKPVSTDAGSALLDPNPLFVELKANAPLPKQPSPKKKRKRPIQSTVPAPAAEAPPPATGFAPAPASPTPGGFGPPPGQIR